MKQWGSLFSGLASNCQSGIWRPQRPTKVIRIESTELSCAGNAYVTSEAGVHSTKATCPSHTTLVGGGFRLSDGNARSPYKPFDGSFGTNSPDISMPFDSESWFVAAGGYPDFCFKAIALCAE